MVLLLLSEIETSETSVIVSWWLRFYAAIIVLILSASFPTRISILNWVHLLRCEWINLVLSIIYGKILIWRSLPIVVVIIYTVVYWVNYHLIVYTLICLLSTWTKILFCLIQRPCNDRSQLRILKIPLPLRFYLLIQHLYHLLHWIILYPPHPHLISPHTRLSLLSLLLLFLFFRHLLFKYRSRHLPPRRCHIPVI